MFACTHRLVVVPLLHLFPWPLGHRARLPVHGHHEVKVDVAHARTGDFVGVEVTPHTAMIAEAEAEVDSGGCLCI